MSTPVMITLAHKGRHGIKLATVICDLVIKGGQLGELELGEWVSQPDPQEPMRQQKRMPRVWLDRLDNAIRTGAFERLPAERIVDIILQGPRE